jgi:hypothetical protein
VTPVSSISHKGQAVGAKVLTGSIIDLLTSPELLAKAHGVRGRIEEDGVFFTAAGRRPAAGMTYNIFRTIR